MEESITARPCLGFGMIIVANISSTLRAHITINAPYVVKDTKNIFDTKVESGVFPTQHSLHSVLSVKHVHLLEDLVQNCTV